MPKYIITRDKESHILEAFNTSKGKKELAQYEATLLLCKTRLFNKHNIKEKESSGEGRASLTLMKLLRCAEGCILISVCKSYFISSKHLVPFLFFLLKH
jgi:hypothetical protein